MQRRLEDVSHFFFDHRQPTAIDQPLWPSSPHVDGRVWTVHVASLGDEFSTAIILAGVARTASRLGRRVLVAATHEQPFGIAFSFALPRGGEASVLVEVASDLWVSSVPLLGARRPGVLCDPSALATWRGRAAQSDLVLVQVNNRQASLRTSGVAVPDEFLIVAGGAEPNWPSHAYHAIKRAVSWNPSVVLGVVAVGEQDEPSGRARNTLAKAVATFLGRQCPMVGSVPSLSALPHAFRAGAILASGMDDVTRAVGAIAGRWIPPDVEPRSRSMLKGAAFADAASARGGRGEGRLHGWAG